MTLTVHLEGPVAGALTAEAARRGQTPDQVAADLIAGQLPGEPAGDLVEAFIGAGDSGDPGWAERHTHLLRAEVAARRGDPA